MVMNTRALDRAKAVSDTGVRTLVVDDSPFMLKILAQILEEAGNFDLVGTATDGCQALRYVSMLSPELILMDAHMPHLNGIQATRYIKQREHPPAIIIVTSDDSAVARATAEEAGADAFVSKEGNLRLQMMRALQKLFGPSSAGQAKASRTSFQNPLQDVQKGSTAYEKSREKDVASESSNSPLAITAIRATRPVKVPGKTNILGKRTTPAPGCPVFGADPEHWQLLRTKPDPSIRPTGRASVRFPTDSAHEKRGV